MSRDPLSVLRLAASMAEFGVPQAEVDEAIAQVEALVKQAKAMLPRRVCLTNTNVPDRMEVPLLATMGELRAFAASVAPFTPGQDSEGAP